MPKVNVTVIFKNGTSMQGSTSTKGVKGLADTLSEKLQEDAVVSFFENDKDAGKKHAMIVRLEEVTSLVVEEIKEETSDAAK